MRFLPKRESGKGEKMFMGSLMPDFGRTDYRVKINDDLRMLHETTLNSIFGYLDEHPVNAYT